MPAVTVGTTPTLIYRSNFGNDKRPTNLTFRTDPESEVTIWTGRDNTVTVGGTDSDTDGLPLLSGEARSVKGLLVGDAVYAVVATGTVDVYYEVNGQK